MYTHVYIYKLGSDWNISSKIVSQNKKILSKQEVKPKNWTCFKHHHLAFNTYPGWTTNNSRFFPNNSWFWWFTGYLLHPSQTSKSSAEVWLASKLRQCQHPRDFFPTAEVGCNASGGELTYLGWNIPFSLGNTSSIRIHFPFLCFPECMPFGFRVCFSIPIEKKPWDKDWESFPIIWF